jgi:hypothetical protein
MDKTYTVPVKIALLADQLVAAGIVPTLVEGTTTWVHIVATDATTAAVDAVVAAHDPTALSVVEQTTASDGASLNDLVATYQTMVDKLNAIQADMATLTTHATTLSGVTVTTLAQVQATLRSLGTDLGMLVADVNALTVGSERVLKAARVFVRRGGTP